MGCPSTHAHKKNGVEVSVLFSSTMGMSLFHQKMVQFCLVDSMEVRSHDSFEWLIGRYLPTQTTWASLQLGRSLYLGLYIYMCVFLKYLYMYICMHCFFFALFSFISLFIYSFISRVFLLINLSIYFVFTIFKILFNYTSCMFVVWLTTTIFYHILRLFYYHIQCLCTLNDSH